MKELNLKDLTLDQKLGMSMVALFWGEEDGDADYIESLIRNHSLGGVWVVPRDGENREYLKRFKAAADYPLLVFTDAESGFGPYKIGSHNALGMTGSEDLAYTFGKITALGARLEGYNVVCNPVLDMVNGNWSCGGNVRSYGCDKEQVARLAAAEARGMHDAGVLTVGKHCPGSPKSGQYIDSHMAETASDETLEDLLDYNYHPYLELFKEGLLDGIMMQHARFTNIDPDYPASLSAEHIKPLRERGFTGFAITDALNMMGVVAKFGRKNSVGLAVGNAGALALPFHAKNETVMNWLRDCYAEGMIPDATLDEVVSYVLAAQHKVAVMEPKFAKITEEDIEKFHQINRNSVFAKCDPDVPVALDRDKEHFFAILTETELEIKDDDQIPVNTMRTSWYEPLDIARKLKERFPASKVGFLSEYPTTTRIYHFLSECLDHGDVVFITYYKTACYSGKECLTPRIISMMEAMQVSDRISTVMHFGNPYVVSDVPHVSRLIVGTCSAEGVDAGIDVLSGEYPAKGVLTYDVPFRS